MNKYLVKAVTYKSIGLFSERNQETLVLKNKKLALEYIEDRRDNIT